MAGSASISTEQYHELSDATMELMLESIENILDAEANDEYEVDYSVSPVIYPCRICCD